MIKPNELYKTTVVFKNIQHYKQYYPNIKIMDVIYVKGEELTPGSKIKVKYICDFCGKEYERTKDSERRSGLEYNACPNCRTKKIQQTCLEKYGVSHPMKDPEIHRRSVEGHINNFGKEYNSCSFENGIPVSKVQRAICEYLNGFILNYLENGYYYDMFNKDLNLVIEYNGKGHDLQVRRNKITREEFEARERIRVQKIRQQHKLLIIEDCKDKLTFHSNFEKWMPEICQAVASLEDYHIITIE